jgi:hypothetical protein
MNTNTKILNMSAYGLAEHCKIYKIEIGKSGNLKHIATLSKLEK